MMTQCGRYKTLLCLMMVALGLMLFSGCIKKIEDDSSAVAAEASTDVSEPVDSHLIVLTGAESKTVLDVLQDSHQVELKTSAMGTFVVAIDSFRNGGQTFWLYSVNGAMGQVACDRFLTRPGDTVRWFFRTIN